MENVLSPQPVFNGTWFFTAALALLGFALSAALVKAAACGIADSARAKAAAAALLSGDLMPDEKKRRARRRYGTGLPLKLASFTISLMLFLVFLVAAPLFVWMTRNRRETLFEGLRDRSQVLLEGLADTAATWLSMDPSLALERLQLLPGRSASLPEARYITITVIENGPWPSGSAWQGRPDGPSREGDVGETGGETVWASNDPGILQKINTPRLEAGVSRFHDGLSPRVGNMVLETEWRRNGEALPAWSGETGSDPPWTPGIPKESGLLLRDLLVYAVSLSGAEEEKGRSHVFYKPVIVRGEDGNESLRGMVRLEVSTELLIEEIVWRQKELFSLIFRIASAVIAIGTAGTLLFSTLIVLPIRRLVRHVELIRDTENVAALEGVEISVKSRDEIALLGNTINDMTRRLVRAAQASQDLTIGKELQKKFIPLDTDREGNKLTTGSRENASARFFGYYEGAKGVSGDYFDYIDLDGRFYAVIKCDVAGKGVPAALIMIQVATMFRNFFSDWTQAEEGMRIEKAVYQINEFIEALGFAGRFAAFSLCLFDSWTGTLRFCNAGDNIVHWYDASERKMKMEVLRETPAAGVLPNFLVDSRGGYSTRTMRLDHGDMLFLYTDGIEEAKRNFRDSKGGEIVCAETVTGPRGVHGNHQPGEAGEALGRSRVEQIINAALNREIWTLRKYHDPEAEDELVFDYSTGNGTVDEAVMALVSAEKIFRIWRPPRRGRAAAGFSYRVLVDRKVDEFLEKHFRQYAKYCSRVSEYAENPGYLYYTEISEDPQYDDLAILAIRRA